MVKTFHHVDPPRSADTPPGKADGKVKTFHHLPSKKAAAGMSVVGTPTATASEGPTPTALVLKAATPPPLPPAEAPIRTFHGVSSQNQPVAPLVLPQVLFAGRAVTAEQVDAAWRDTVASALPACDCDDFVLEDRDVQRIRNLLGEIHFDDAHYQSRYAAEVTELMRQLQDQLALLVADQTVAQLHQSAALILAAAKRVDVTALDPGTFASRLSDWWRGREARRGKLRQQFDTASRDITAQIKAIQPVLAKLKLRLREFGELFERNELLFGQLTVHVVAAHLKLGDVIGRDVPAREAELKAKSVTDPFVWQDLHALRDAGEQWQRKLHNLKLLRHTALLTLPQLRLSQRNLLAMVGRFDDISEIVMPTWKQQFITALAMADTDDSRLYGELADLQAGLREQLERLSS
ncbi:hypothetical protein FNU76_23195 [Chitinimonas arctica]|uniref:Toxic anion resistance protein n=1 Tax=Chitinimonas arctica TaxID=2594795 RepID=A0A516SLH7_9NEIS|nr:toxic anion resistance protein [Chitinimonas arctica]QDQ29017.1 hypothetical protein FNU76_23195 [Chitinimonas arctica]